MLQIGSRVAIPSWGPLLFTFPCAGTELDADNPEKPELVPGIHEILVEAPQLAAKARPGHFVIVMADERGERIPLTIADYDCAAGTVTLVLMVVGTTSRKLASSVEGRRALRLDRSLGPPVGDRRLRHGGDGRRRRGYGARLSDCQGIQASVGSRVISIQGASNADLLFWQDRLAAVSDQHIVTTDDGSAGRKGLVTEPLKELLAGAGRRARSAASTPSGRRS